MNRAHRSTILMPLLVAAIGTASLLAPLAGASGGAEDAAAIITRVESPQSPDRRGFDSLSLPELMARLRVPGVSIAAIRDFEIHWTKTYGVADAETGRTVEASTLFQAASISKPVTAMAALRLAQEGRLSLDADINSVLTSWKVPASPLTSGRPVTARALLSHTSGSDDGFGFPGYPPDATRPTPVQILNGEPPSNLGSVLFVRPPFEAYKYSGGGTTIVQVALTDVAGAPFSTVMENLVLKPLGMTESTFEQPLPAANDRQAARAHDGRGRRMGAPWHIYPEQAAAGLWTTPRDLARFVIEIQRAVAGSGGKVLSQASAREMVTPIGIGPYAVGLALDRRGEGWYLMHGGSNWGFRASMIGHTRKGHGVVVMTNGDAGGGLIGEIEARVAAAYNWDSLHKPIPR